MGYDSKRHLSYTWVLNDSLKVATFLAEKIQKAGYKVSIMTGKQKFTAYVSKTKTYEEVAVTTFYGSSGSGCEWEKKFITELQEEIKKLEEKLAYYETGTGNVFVACFSSFKIAQKFSAAWSRRIPIYCKGCAVRRLAAGVYGVSVPVALSRLSLPAPVRSHSLVFKSAWACFKDGLFPSFSLALKSAWAASW
ncbi:MAG: hypothetical protein HQK76_20090 [Desulfobacterales bacterium]|nr:hypothetical protein [Desulfobacterales bacterium]